MVPRTRARATMRWILLLACCAAVHAEFRGGKGISRHLYRHALGLHGSSDNHRSGNAPLQEPIKSRIHEVQQWAAHDGLVIWTLANYGWIDFLLNWIAAVRKANISHFFVACLDEKTLTEMKRMGVPSIGLKSKFDQEELEWGSVAFKDRGQQKIKFIVEMLEAGLQPIFSDLDSVWLKDPLEFLRQYEDADALVSTDSCMPITSQPDNCPSLLGDEEKSQAGLGIMNVGVHLLRPKALPFAKAWLKEMVDTDEMEQRCWNNVFHRQWNRSMAVDAYCRSDGGQLVVGLLPAATFMNGESFFNQKSHRVRGFEPYIVHASFIPGKIGKEEHFVEAGLWQVNSSASGQLEKGLLHLELEIPDKLLINSGPPDNIMHPLTRSEVQGHLALVWHQYLQVASAAELAWRLNLTLVVPTLWCGLENLWSAHAGRFGDFLFDLPMQCSFLQIFDIMQWRRLEKKGLIPSYSTDPRLKAQASRASTLVVGGCSAGAVHNSHSNQTLHCDVEPGVVRLAPGMQKMAILDLIQGAGSGSANNLLLRDVQSWWPQTATPEGVNFSSTFEEVLRPWCCADDNQPIQIKSIQTQ